MWRLTTSPNHQHSVAAGWMGRQQGHPIEDPSKYQGWLEWEGTKGPQAVEDWGKSGKNWIVTVLQFITASGTTQVALAFYRNESSQQREGFRQQHRAPHTGYYKVSEAKLTLTL